MTRRGMLPARLAKCPIPICTACLYGKATKRPWRTKPSQEELTKAGHPTLPGQCVSVDFLTSPTPGLVAHMTGTPTSKRYHHAAVYVDNATGYGFIWLQKSISEEETITGKIAFERHCAQNHITVQHYRADNGIFASNAWKNACQRQNQRLTFTGVNAHHQNGIAERRIEELQAMARTMLLHAQRRWPSAITANLWPYAIRMASDAMNATPRVQDPNHATPVELFAKTSVVSNPKHWHHFGCPVYVLAEPLQGSTGIYHKWKERSKVGLYLGRSPQHSREVALVLNLETGLVSPQFHVKIDTTFQTLREPGTEAPQSLWQAKCGFIAHASRISQTNNRSTNDSKESQSKSFPTFQLAPPSTVPLEMDSPDPQPNEVSEGGQTQDMPDMAAEHPPLRRSTRVRRPVDRLMMETILENDVEGEVFCLMAMFPDYPTEEHPLLTYAASADPDTMYLHQALKEPDRKQFIQAMTKEVDDQIAQGNFVIILRSQVPKGERVLPAVWAMRRKRRIHTGQVYKWKARLNIDGSKQIKGLDYWETYAPVADWASVRLLLTHAVINKWHTRQIDYVQAYLQARVEKDMYMEIPKGFHVNGEGDYVLKILKNIYGQKQAGRVWNNHLVQKLKQVGFKQLQNAPCVFVKGQNIYVLYTDDSILMGPDSKELDSIIQSMKDVDLNITVEGGISDFLGVNIQYKSDGTIHLTQPQLIESILKELRLDDTAKRKNTPAASSKILARYNDSEPFDDSFHYRRVIGKLNYLEKSTRPDIAYAVHQCARFSSDPKIEHGRAVRWLARYLLATKDKGLILQPSGNALEVYVDADFAGNYNIEDASEEKYTARSRYGFIIRYRGCPINWASRMQTEIALSSTESEFIGLSQSLRQAIPLMELINELNANGIDMATTKPKVYCKVFEDNSGAIELATVPKMRPRTKHINIKYHHFRDYVDRGEITIHAIRSEDQPADMLTKPLNENPLCRHRSWIMGW
jgi:Reverse transcriptase (RNA-dependent DNA polymerase)